MELRISEEDSAPQPFVKWVGGKRQIAATILDIAGVQGAKLRFNGYFEPFVGGGAMFYHLKQEGFLEGCSNLNRIHLSDVNTPLLVCYRSVQMDVEALIKALETHRNSHYDDLTNANAKDLSRADRGELVAVRGERTSLYKTYIKVRSDYNKLKQEFSIGSPDNLSEGELNLAAMFLYLNRAGFNGMYRENASGEMNIPPGRYVKPELVNAPVLRACAKALHGVDLQVRGFEEALRQVKQGDLVYLDPPYFDTFTAYSKGGFDYDAQVQLASLAAAAAKRGAKVIISNSDTEEMRNLYNENGFTVGELKAARNINSDGKGRAKVTEIVAYNSLT
jgi:DNA adenine methylase